MKPNIIIKALVVSSLMITATSCQAKEPAKTVYTLTSGYVDLTTAAEQSVDAVVYIKTEFMQKNPVWDDFFGGTIWEHFFGMDSSPYPVHAAGSGVIVSSDGYIMTNNHVVQDAVKVTVTLNDKREYSGEVIGTDPSADLALVKIDEKGLKALPFGNSDSLRIGEWVLAVGNPLNLTSTVTAGIVSAKARQLEFPGKSKTEESYIQTDAAVNSGNSGGALVNVAGQLVGINTAIATGNGYYTGYSFAIPSNIVSKIYRDLKDYGRVQNAYIGVSIAEVNAQVAEQYGIDEIKGMYVAKVEENSAAAKNGFREGDIILRVDSTPVNSIAEMRGVLKTKSPGDKVDVLLVRDKEKMTKNVTLLNEEGTTGIIRKTGGAADF